MASLLLRSTTIKRRMKPFLPGLFGYWCVVDNVVIFNSNEDKHVAHVHQFLQRCAEYTINLNKNKWECAKPRVTFALFQLSQDGYSIDAAIINTITQFPTHTNRTKLRDFLGLPTNLVQVPTLLQTYTGTIAADGQQFLRLSIHDQAFTKAKQYVSSAPTLSYFDAVKPTCMCTDASRHGLRFVL